MDEKENEPIEKRCVICTYITDCAYCGLGGSGAYMRCCFDGICSGQRPYITSDAPDAMLAEREKESNK